MNKWLIYIIAGGILAAGYIYALKVFGDSRYDAGVSSQTVTCVSKGEEANEGARQTRDEADLYEKTIPDTGLVDELHSLGILRPTTAH